MDNPRTHAEREAAQRADEEELSTDAATADEILRRYTLEMDAVLMDTRAHILNHGTLHTHPCPTCHRDRSCTCTVFAPGDPLECATCSNCRGW